MSNRSPNGLGSSSSLRSQYAYDAIIEMLENGELEPGDRLPEGQIADRLGISRTPVREALQLLQTRRIVITAPGRGLVVASFDIQQVVELYAVREVLEGAAARSAASNATDVQIELIKKLAAKYASTEAESKESLELNQEFHQLIYLSARNQFLEESLAVLSDARAILRSVSVNSLEHHAVSVAEHTEIVDAIAQHDPERAERAGRKHIQTVQKRRVQAMLNI